MHLLPLLSLQSEAPLEPKPKPSGAPKYNQEQEVRPMAAELLWPLK